MEVFLFVHGRSNEFRTFKRTTILLNDLFLRPEETNQFQAQKSAHRLEGFLLQDTQAETQ